MTFDFVKQPALAAKYLKYYTDKAQPVEPETGHNPPIIVADRIMDHFIEASSIINEHSKERKNELVRVGDFKGVIGKVVRAAGQHVGINIERLGTFVTAYIPNDFMEILNDEKK